MTTTDFLIREIQPKDNAQLAKVIQSVIVEMGAPKTGTAYEDEATQQMFETYQKPNAVYFVVEHQKKIVGGAGISQLENANDTICELQKMYFSPIARGKGIGYKLLDICLEKAASFGFKTCYLETLPYMKDAQKLYKKLGFCYIDAPMGNTGHSSCDVWMTKKITS
jgi:putative acetyltransferase